MDTRGLEESNFLTVQAVKDSPTKRLVILSSGTMQPNKENLMKLNMLVEVDSKQKTWALNKTTIRNLQQKFGFDSALWIGKSVQLSLSFINGKESIIGTPV